MIFANSNQISEHRYGHAFLCLTLMIYRFETEPKENSEILCFANFMDWSEIDEVFSINFQMSFV